MAVAEEFLKEGLRVYPTDPLTLNELGVLAYRKAEWVEAVAYFRRALTLIAATSSSSSASSLVSAWESLCINLGHALRKQSKYPQALVAYQQALAPPAVAHLQAIEDAVEERAVKGALMGEGLGLGGVGAGGGGDGVHRAVLTSMGFTCHLMGELERAIQLYHQVSLIRRAPRSASHHPPRSPCRCAADAHSFCCVLCCVSMLQALASASRDTLTSDLLSRALQEITERPMGIR